MMNRGVIATQHGPDLDLDVFRPFLALLAASTWLDPGNDPTAGVPVVARSPPRGGLHDPPPPSSDWL